MVWIPAGEFWMGAQRARVDGFWMDRTEVTNAQFEAFVTATGYVTVAEKTPKAEDSHITSASWRRPEGPASDLVGKSNYPVVNVAWPDAAAYAKWVGKRLPTEAEWEFAARGGRDRQPFVWDDPLSQDGVAPVALFPANGYGLHDMAGNVSEWVSDRSRPGAVARGADHLGFRCVRTP